ncbi:MAG: hypothetical protein OEU36_07015 [Gammaproteobacteria bacterium]|nr:hypothetical protein [Gammaproteobacteria bacterium]
MAKPKKSRKLRVRPATASTRRAQKKKKHEQFVLTTHKVRSEWFRDNAAWPMREAPALQLLQERARIRRSIPLQPLASAWTMAGPTNIGGRMTSVVVHPQHPDEIWVGAAGGGVWHSVNAGQSWESLWDKQDSLNVGALAIDPNDPEIIYCGTGEANLSADSYPGVGLYRTTDGGASWQLIRRADTNGIAARIGAIAINPFDSNHILIGGVGHYLAGQAHTGGMGGLYESPDGGQSWLRYGFISVSEYRCHSIVFHPTQAGTFFISVTEQGFSNGIWRTTDNGNNWTHLTQGLPSPERFNRTSLAIAPSNPDRIYALASDNSSRVLGVFRSDNGGDSWSPIHGTSFHYQRQVGTFFDQLERQMTYNNTIAVSPADPDRVICGGVDLHLSINGGTTWQNVTIWDAERGESNYAHADQHALSFSPSNPSRVYALNDGGMDFSDDGGLSWSNRSDGLATNMFYDYDVAQTNSNYYGGGAQDNGTLVTIEGKSDDHFDITGGDGGWLVFDPQDENHIYSSIYSMNIFRFPAHTGNPNRFEDVSPTNTDPGEKEDMWMVYIAIDPADSNTVFTGTRRVWRTQNDGASWQPVSTYFHGRVSAIEIARADSDRIYVGTSHGEIFRSLDGGGTWSDNLASATLPGFKITRIRSRPDNADRVIATVANFGAPHVYRSDDGCLTWEDVDQGVLPNVPHNAISIPAQHPDEVYVANDIGVFRSIDFGENWENITGNLPNVSVIDIIYHDNDDTLTAATYGRSAWRVQVR